MVNIWVLVAARKQEIETSEGKEEGTAAGV